MNIGLFAAGATNAAQTVNLVIDYGDGVQKHFPKLAWNSSTTVLGVLQSAAKHPRGIDIKVRSSGSTAFLTQIDDVANQGGG